MRLSRLQEQEPQWSTDLSAWPCAGIGVDMINRALHAGPIGTELRGSLVASSPVTMNSTGLYARSKRSGLSNLSAGDDLFPHFPVTWLGTLLKGDMIDLYEKLLPLAAEPFYISAEKISAIQQDSYSTPMSISLIGLLFSGVGGSSRFCQSQFSTRPLSKGLQRSPGIQRKSWRGSIQYRRP